MSILRYTFRQKREWPKKREAVIHEPKGETIEERIKYAVAQVAIWEREYDKTEGKISEYENDANVLRRINEKLTRLARKIECYRHWINENTEYENEDY